MDVSVTERKTGAISETEGQKSPAGDGKIPGEASKVSSETPKTYTEAEHKAVIHALQSEAGRARVEIEKERDTYKSQLAIIQSELTDNAAEIEKLQEKFDAMASDDPDKFELAKEIKTAREERKQLKIGRTTLEAEKLTYGERIKHAESFEREALIQEIVEDYEGADFDKIKDLCDTFGATSEEQIRKVADTLWTKAVVTPEPEISLKTPSGVTSGGAEDYSNLSPREKIDKGIEKLKKK